MVQSDETEKSNNEFKRWFEPCLYAFFWSQHTHMKSNDLAFVIQPHDLEEQKQTEALILFF